MNRLSITLVLLLFPGIIATAISDKTAVHSKWDSFRFALYSLVLGLFTYSLLNTFYVATAYLLYGHFPQEALQIWQVLIKDNIKIDFSEIALATLLAPVTATLATVLTNKKTFLKISQYFKISQKYGDENLFSYFLNAKEIDWVNVRDIENNLTYQGQIESFSENDKIQEITLRNVSIYRYEDSLFLNKAPHVYLPVFKDEVQHEGLKNPIQAIGN